MHRHQAVHAFSSAHWPIRMSEEIHHPSSDSPSHPRLSPIVDPLAPWRKARELERCFLYWIPVDGFPIPVHQRTWLMSFLDRLGPTLADQFGLRVEVFLQKTVVQQLTERFVNTSMDFFPKLGLCRRSSDPLPTMPSKEEVEGLVEQAKQREKIVLDKWLPQSCYWFSAKAERQQRENFFGHGGMTMIFLKPDPATVPPKLPFTQEMIKRNELLRMANLDDLLARAFAARDSFLSKSKELFGDPSRKDELFFRGLRFILPLLGSTDFFAGPQEQFDKWFELFDIYLNESPLDGGIVLASKLDFETALLDILKTMKDEGLTYFVR